MKITVLLGGTSSERDVSIASGARIAAALRERGHDVTAVDTAHGALTEAQEAELRARRVETTPPSNDVLARMARETLPQLQRLLPKLAEADVVFLALHGGHGEDGTVQAMLDLTGIPYTGSGHLASALAMDKDLSKQLFRAAGVPTADWRMARRGETGRAALGSLDVPVVVKPSKQGSTVGLSVVKEVGGMGAAVEEAFRHDDEVMVEAFVAGRELTVAILGGEALPVGEIIPKHEIYDYECKYTAGMAEERFPAELTADETREVQELAKRAFAALKLRGCARIDFRMSERGGFYCLEANTLPGMTQLSLVPQAAAAAGMDFGTLCERITLEALNAPSTGA